MDKKRKILIVQTAFIGDVILATALVEKLFAFFPQSKIDFLLRKGNESLLDGHPKINKVLIWNKKTQKHKNLFNLIKQVRSNDYDLVINLQRFFSSGMITALSGAKEKRGFKKNPMARFFSRSFEHTISTAPNSPHELDRNHQLIADLTDRLSAKPKLYPPKNSVKVDVQYVTMSPASVWFTKMLPKEKWISLINKLGASSNIYLLGGPDDVKLCNEIKVASKHSNKVNIMAGRLSLLESAALMKNAKMNYVNDSAPLHLASAMNAPITAFFCSTVPAFGFGPVSDVSIVMETNAKLGCRPCGITGKAQCPEGHFNCAKIDLNQISI